MEYTVAITIFQSLVMIAGLTIAVGILGYAYFKVFKFIWHLIRGI